jgi:hypothetical protein
MSRTAFVVLTNTRAISDALGGDDALKRMFKTTQNRVNNWHRFKEYPAHTHDTIRTELHALGYDAPPALFGQTPAAKGWKNKPTRKARKVMG